MSIVYARDVARVAETDNDWSASWRSAACGAQSDGYSSSFRSRRRRQVMNASCRRPVSLLASTMHGSMVGTLLIQTRIAGRSGCTYEAFATSPSPHGQSARRGTTDAASHCPPQHKGMHKVRVPVSVRLLHTRRVTVPKSSRHRSMNHEGCLLRHALHRAEMRKACALWVLSLPVEPTWLAADRAVAFGSWRDLDIERLVVYAFCLPKEGGGQVLVCSARRLGVRETRRRRSTNEPTRPHASPPRSN